jgi:tetratricopeptide (TPR) repeat protein
MVLPFRAPGLALTHALLLSVILFIPDTLNADNGLSDSTIALSSCDGHYAEPALAHALPARTCSLPVERKYTPRHRGIGFEILDSESKACFVPDQEYQLLDELVDAVSQRITYNKGLQDVSARAQQALTISKIISETLDHYGFALAIDTVTLSDALLQRDPAVDHTQHEFDCDTGSFIFLTIAENLRAPVAMVRMQLPSENFHYWLRWQDGTKTLLEWDMNGRLQCRTPLSLPAWQGISMSRGETLGYALSLRASLWERKQQYELALADYRATMTLEPHSPIGYNGFAWLVATKEFFRPAALRDEAMKTARTAVSISPSPNHLDTLACTFALFGDYKSAIAQEAKAVSESSKPSFRERLAHFRETPPKDCTGADDSNE